MVGPPNDSAPPEGSAFQRPPLGRRRPAWTSSSATSLLRAQGGFQMPVELFSEGPSSTRPWPPCLGLHVFGLCDPITILSAQHITDAWPSHIPPFAPRPLPPATRAHRPAPSAAPAVLTLRPPRLLPSGFVPLVSSRAIHHLLWPWLDGLVRCFLCYAICAVTEMIDRGPLT